MIAKAAVAVVTSAVLTAPVAFVWLRQVDTSIRTPESFWPETIVGWLAASLSLVAIISVFYSLHRFSQKPVLSQITGLQKELKALQEHYDRQIAAVQKHYDHEVERLIATQTREIKSLGETVSKDINGWSGRISDSAQRIDAQATTLGEVRLDAREAKANAEHIKAAVDRISERLLAMPPKSGG